MMTKERPILFSAPMVRALLAGTKTQTRRAVKLPRGCSWYDDLGGEREGWWQDEKHPAGWWHLEEMRCPYGSVGDHLWCRETHYFIGETGEVFFRATNDSNMSPPLRWAGPWAPSIFMRRKHSRITLEITDVRVQRLQEISENDAKAEGIVQATGGWWSGSEGSSSPTARGAYALLWDSINGPGSWDANPWVWALTFKVVKP